LVQAPVQAEVRGVFIQGSNDFSSETAKTGARASKFPAMGRLAKWHRAQPN